MTSFTSSLHPLHSLRGEFPQVGSTRCLLAPFEVSNGILEGITLEHILLIMMSLCRLFDATSEADGAAVTPTCNPGTFMAFLCRREDQAWLYERSH